ncbi:MAG TPA: sigma-54-dependent Fis family transcriptional regulator [Planctomycetaceae bacterium]|nr:sigma-54-dependent Fis family transcriptional regulator [Planctomycetaceae bacterium]
MKALATVVRGTASEKKYQLDASQPIRIGRGNGCQIYLSDPLSSRTHAIISYEAGKWTASDADSRNGTQVNGTKIGTVELFDGDRIQIGSTELLFELPNTDEDTEPSGQTLVLEAQISREASGVSAMSQLYSQKRSQDMLDLYQLSTQLLRCTSPAEVASTGLEMLRVRTQSTAVGFLWIDDQGELRPQAILPEQMADRIRLSKKLTERVSRDGRAVWVKDRLSSPGNSPGSSTNFADAICVPMLSDSAVMGAIHLYRDEGKFDQSHFEFTISAASILAAALESSRAQASLSAEHNRLVQRSADFDELIGECPAMRKLKDRIGRVSRASGCALVRGESGVGKELVSRAIHRLSPRCDRPLLCVNCAAIPEELMESQLFGHKKGAFTGADKDHQGWFQQAHTGTLFLDEVGELNLEGQAKLLRILEGHPFMPVGDTKEVTVDVRVIAATNRDLREYVREKKFREDLYYRLSVFELQVPPLRERGQDIEVLMDHFLAHFRIQHGRPNLKLSPASRKMMLAYRWPGNVRQLRNVIDSAVVLAAGKEILPSDLSLRDVGTDQLDSLRIEVWEERLIREALRRTDNNINESAKLLGVSRATLYRKLEQFGIER